MHWIEHDHDTPDALVAHVADALEQACHGAIRERGSAWLALAGGRTPLPAYAALAEARFEGAITVIPTDDRCVPHDHPACNLRALRAAFAANPAIVANGLTTADGGEAASLRQARALLALAAQPFDAVLLGMGTDGHIASLFPGAPNLAEGLALEGGADAIAVRPDPLPPEAPYPRISLTLSRLLRARELHLVVTGEDKRRVLREAARQADPARLPVAALLQARDHRLQVHWSP